MGFSRFWETAVPLRRKIVLLSSRRPGEVGEARRREEVGIEVGKQEDDSTEVFSFEGTETRDVLYMEGRMLEEDCHGLV